MYEAGKKVQYNVSTMENGKFKLQITIPMMYQEKFAFKDSKERIELELFIQQELARVFKIPEYLLSSEISVVDVKPGSVVTYCSSLLAWVSSRPQSGKCISLKS